MTASGSTTTTTTTTGADCHFVPCNIHYDGMAPVHMFLVPTAIDGDRSDCNDEEKQEQHNADDTIYYASQFRGRGLMSKQPTELPSGIEGHVIVESTDNSSSPLHVTSSSFKQVYEWQHEHDIKVVKTQSRSKDKKNELYTVERAMEWCDVARAVHDPIQPDED